LGRILCMDYGAARTGIAVTDELQLIATPLETVPTAELLTFLQSYTTSETVDLFVVGLPRDLRGEKTHATDLVMEFSKKLQQKFSGIPVKFVDERFTSKMALQTQITGGMKKKDRRNKANLDSISAVIILQSFLEQSRI